MKYLTAIASFGFALTSVLASFVDLNARDSATAWPAGANITSLGVNGSGCPAGTVTTTFNSTTHSLGLSFSKFEAGAGPDFNITEHRVACIISLGIRAPQGYRFRVASFEAEGRYQLDSQVTASQQALYWFQGQLAQDRDRSDLKGPVPSKDYKNSIVFPGLIESPCGAATVVNIQSSISVNNEANNAASGYISIQSLQDFEFRWYKC